MPRAWKELLPPLNMCEFQENLRCFIFSLHSLYQKLSVRTILYYFLVFWRKNCRIKMHMSDWIISENYANNNSSPGFVLEQLSFVFTEIYNHQLTMYTQNIHWSTQHTLGGVRTAACTRNPCRRTRPHIGRGAHSARSRPGRPRLSGLRMLLRSEGTDVCVTMLAKKNNRIQGGKGIFAHSRIFEQIWLFSSDHFPKFVSFICEFYVKQTYS